MRAWFGVAAVIVAMAAVVISLAVWPFLERRREQEALTRAVAAQDEAAIPDAVAVVKAGLKDPGSAQFSELRVVGAEMQQRVCGLVNAKNSYGGYTGNQRFLVMAGSAYYGDDRPGPIVWDKPEHPCDAS